jgi:hypothetical protein
VKNARGVSANAANVKLLTRWAALPGLIGQALAVALSAGCSGGGSPIDMDPPVECAGTSIDRFKELVIVDDDVISDARSSNAKSGHWSFRHVVEQLAPPGMGAAEFVSQWLETFMVPTKVNLYPVDKRESVLPLLLCPWWKQTPSNKCDADCLNCAAKELDFAKAPFRLMAITNRIDLRDVSSTSDTVGEGRLAFSLTNGPGDDPASEPLQMSLIFEYRLPESEGRDTRYWAERWHALAFLDTGDESFRAALQDITDSFTMRGTDPDSADRPSINQIRTNEHTFFWLWQQREFLLTESGLLVSPTDNTPDKSLNNTDELRDFLLSNKDAILQGLHVLPPTLTGGAADQEVVWTADVAEPLRSAFAKQTCNGCHLSENPSVDTSFHVSPFRKGVDRLSPFLHNPADPTTDELARREAFMRQALCGK